MTTLRDNAVMTIIWSGLASEVERTRSSDRILSSLQDARGGVQPQLTNNLRGPLW
jgi:hypothetical protein